MSLTPAQSRMLVADELVDRTKNCCLTPVDFLEAVVRLADAMPKTGDSWPTTEETFEVNGMHEQKILPRFCPPEPALGGAVYGNKMRDLSTSANIATGAKGMLAQKMKPFVSLPPSVL